MNFPFYIAKRYIFSKKSTHAINIISIISVIGVAVATTALVVILSGFNGFADLVASFFTNFDPQIKVEPAQGKTMKADDAKLLKLKALPEIETSSICLEDQALAVYQDHQMMVKLKGVDDNFAELSGIKNILYGDGEYTLHAADLQYGIPGIGVAQQLGLGAVWNGYLRIYAPRRQGQFDMTNPDNAFAVDSLLSPGVVFQVKQGKYDRNYLITSLAFAQSLFRSPGEISSMEFRLKAGEDVDKVKEEMKQILGPSYTVKDRYEQQADTFKIMKVEKLFAYIFLTFILVIACFNIIGSLSMLIIDKKDDIVTLRNLGANDKQIRGGWCCAWNSNRSAALLVATDLWHCPTGRPGRQLRCKCLPYQRSSAGYSNDFLYGYHCRLARCMVSGKEVYRFFINFLPFVITTPR